jgi:phage protein D
MPVRQPLISKVVINGSIATASIGLNITEFSYTEEPGFGRSHCEFDLLYSASIIPVIGDYIEIQIKYLDTATTSFLTTGTHRVNDVVYDHNRDIYSVGMIAFDFNGGALNEAGYTYSNATIRAIVQTQATQLSLTLDNPTGISAEIAGVGQNATDAKIISGKSRSEILEKLANEYGFFLRVKTGVIYFYDFLSFEVDPATLNLARLDVTSDASSSGRRSTDGCASAIRVNYVSSGSVVYSDLAVTGTNVSNRLINLQSNGILANGGAAGRYAYGASRISNKDQHVVSTTLIGSHSYLLGAIAQLSSFSVDDGKYFIRKCVHTLRPSESWRTMLELQRIFTI